MDKIRLVVIDGPLSGASELLLIDSKHTIGTSIKNDIYFNDGTEIEQQIEILVGPLDVCLFLIKGSAKCGHKELAVGVKHKLKFGGNVSLGNSVFTVRREEEEILSANSIEDAGTRMQVENGRNSSKLRMTAFVVLLGGGLVATGAATINNRAGKNMIPAEVEPSVEELIRSTGIANLRVMQMASGGFVVKGVLASRQERQKLEKTIKDTSELISIDTLYADEVTQAVNEVYRISGVDAEISSAIPGSVVVKTETADLDLLDQVEAAAYRDVPNLRALRRINDAPEPIKEAMPDYALDPDKKVIVVVAGDPSYVMTQDRSRYFLGSVLPSGHTIVEIIKDKVLLGKDGVTSELKI